MSIQQPGDRRIKTSFEIVTEESAAEGDVAERGWENEEGVDMEPDEVDRDDDVTGVDKAVEFLEDEGATYPSSSEFHRGVWYSAESVLAHGGGWKTRSFHLHGFSPQEEEEIWEGIREGLDEESYGR